MELDYTILNARRVLMKRSNSLKITVVGCGGTGSWIVPHIVRLARLVQDAAENPRQVKLELWDPDTVEEKNLYRQNFSAPEIGMNKAQTLAFRYGTHWGIDVRALPVPFEGNKNYDLLIGCVDNPHARQTIHDLYRGDHPGPFWLDCGNATDQGQVLLGNTLHQPELAFPVGDVCVALPIPTIQHPELLQPDPLEQNNPFLERMSCAEQALHGNQGLTVNAKIAAEAADYFYRLVLKGNLRKYATYFDLISGVARSKYITPALNW